MAWTIIRTSKFKKGYKNKPPDLRARVDEAIRQLVETKDPYDLGRPKHGSLRNCYGYDIDSRHRLLYSADMASMVLFLLRVCSHKDVY